MIQKQIGLILLAAGIVFGIWILASAAKHRDDFKSEAGSLPALCLAEVLIYFCATLGISDFLLNTLTLRGLHLAEDKKIPGTLIAAGLTPGAVIAFSLLQVENPVDLLTLLLCAASITLGGALGSRIVGRIDGSKIKRVMGIALIASMIALIAKIIIASGATGTATGLTAKQLCIAIPYSILWGMMNMLGVPGKPAGTAFFLLMGMSPLSTLTLVLVMACIGPMGGAFSVLKNGRYHRKLSCAAVIFGSIGAIAGCIFAISVNALVLNILLIAVMLIAIVSLLKK